MGPAHVEMTAVTVIREQLYVELRLHKVRGPDDPTPRVRLLVVAPRQGRPLAGRMGGDGVQGDQVRTEQAVRALGKGLVLVTNRTRG